VLRISLRVSGAVGIEKEICEGIFVQIGRQWIYPACDPLGFLLTRLTRLWQDLRGFGHLGQNQGFRESKKQRSSEAEKPG
jgi:hypothetical protein